MKLVRWFPLVALWALGCGVAGLFGPCHLRAADVGSQDWRPLPLITDGKIDPGWYHVGWGRFVVDGDALRTECDARGLGLLVYGKEKLGNCQIRVVVKSKAPESNAGVFVRIAEGIREQIGKPGAAFDRDSKGRISAASKQKAMESGEREEGPWYAVHNGYEVQIMDENDSYHRTGAIYSLAPSSSVAAKTPGQWRTMIITLAGKRILVEVDGKQTTSFDPAALAIPQKREWFEPKRENQRPEAGYLGLQNHDPGDIVWFKEVSVRPLLHH